MEYGLRYYAECDTLAGERLRVEIEKQNYSGSVDQLILGGTPIVHSYESDDLYKAIKGSRVALTFVGIGIDAFVADSDIEFKVTVKKNNGTVFVGFLSQDDFTEEDTETLHSIDLVATDALGFLRDKRLDENNLLTQTATGPRQFMKIFDDYTIQINTPADESWLTPGNKIVLSSYDIPVGQINGTYTIKEASYTSTTATLTLVEPVPAAYPLYDVDFYFLIRQDLQQVLPIQYFVDAVLSVTNLELMQELRFTLHELYKPDLFQSMMDGKTFLTDDQTYMSCYDVLNNILERFRISIQQINGKWIFLRWPEFTKIATPDANVKPFVKVFGLEKSIVRPYGTITDTFKLQQPKNIIRNINLLELGGILSYEEKMVDGVLQKITYYKALHWYPALATDVIKIAVVKDSFDVEVDRYLSVKGYAALTENVLFNADDYLDISFNVKSIKHTSGTSTIPFGAIITNGADTYGYSDQQRWKKHGVDWYGSIYLGRHFAFQTNTDLYQGAQVEIDTKNAPIPIDGNFFLSLSGGGPQNTELQYRNISVKYSFTFLKSKQIDAQRHTNRRNDKLLNRQDEEIKVDQSIKFQARGTIYSDSTTLATKFMDAYGSYDLLGQEATELVMLQHSFPALSFEGDIIADLDMDDVIKIDTKYLAPVYLQKDYKRGTIKCKFVEVRNDTMDNSGRYKFDYINGEG